MPNRDLFSNKASAERVRAVLVAVSVGNDRETEELLDELERLLDTAGGETAARMIQSKSAPDPRTYIGSGKVRELAELCRSNEISLAIFNDELTPSQIRNLESDMGGTIRVIDRSMLILDIFALHAVTNEGKLQVELAQLKYTAPRLTGQGTQLSRQGGSGSIAARGPGETKLETDRRHIRARMQMLESQLEELEKNRGVQRRQREKSGLMQFAIAGYTNAGKSTLLNYLTGAGILAEDKLFATLDPTTRRFTLPCGSDILLTDTVGFIRSLPHHLVKAFKSTLDEVRYADAVIVVIDAADPQYAEQLSVTRQLLRDLEAEDKPILYAFNKCDLPAEAIPRLSDVNSEDVIYLSAATGRGVDALVSRMEALALNGKSETVFVIPNAEQGALNTLYAQAVVSDIEYGPETVTVRATVDARVRGMLRRYLATPDPKPEEEW